MDLMNSDKRVSFLINNGVFISCCSTCEKGEPEITEDYGQVVFMEFEL